MNICWRWTASLLASRKAEHCRENERASDGRPDNRQQSRCVYRKAAETALGVVQAKGDRGTVKRSVARPRTG
jgi:hypothetical protein